MIECKTFATLAELQEWHNTIRFYGDEPYQSVINIETIKISTGGDIYRVWYLS